MKQQQFEVNNAASWDRFEASLEADAESLDGADFIRLYRQLCHDLAVAQQRQYSPYLIDRLNRLVMAGHQRLYQRKSRFWEETLRFVAEGLPRAVRENGRLMCLAAACFFGPALLFGFTVYVFPSLVYSVFNLDQIRGFTDMYDPKSHDAMKDARTASDDLMMFGFYIKNNIGIAFQTFAGGILFGVGTLFFLAYNGIVIGGVAGHLTEIGHVNSFYSFVITHGAFELTAIVMAGAAGFRLGQALLMPGDLTRLAALRRAARESMPLVYGIILFLLVAAFLEAFWSSSSLVPAWLKYLVGSSLWTLVLSYFLLAGRDHGSR
jgi:uncharacterized membrane protein SpoIIM required for sporulation